MNIAEDCRRICLWSGPRNISTALMYSFAQRKDTQVFDEPLYAHYLSKTEARNYHPGAEEVIAAQENDGEKVVRKLILGKHDSAIVFFKMMTHHLHQLDRSFLAKTRNVILIRDPKEMLVSYVNQVAAPTLADVGYRANAELYDELRKIGKAPVVLDARQTLLNPGKVLAELCNAIGIEFDERMLKWQPGARPEDGVWAKYWYQNVHESSGFQPYQPKKKPLPKHLNTLLEECQPYYDKLSLLAISADN